MYTNLDSTDHGLALTVSRFTHDLAGRPFRASEQEWKAATLRSLTTMPSVEYRCYLAANCSLAALKLLALDADEEVRLASTQNPFVVDMDVQMALAADPSDRVTVALLRQVDVCREAAELVVAGGHRRAQAALAAKRNLPMDLVKRLAAVLPSMAARTGRPRGRIVVATKQPR